MGKLKDNEFTDILIDECNKQNIEINENIANKLLLYKKILLDWNDKINLTAITDDYEIIVKHFVDCLECTKVIEKEINIIDIGTGAGFPGLVLAIFFPEKHFTLLDGLNKRINFLQDVINKLGLKNVVTVHARAEELAKNSEYFQKFDACVSRAVANLPVLLEYISPYIKVNGKLIIMKGDNVSEELELSNNALKILKLKNIKEKGYNYCYEINNEKYNRTILYIEKQDNTPNKYPRNYGKIKKNPL